MNNEVNLDEEELTQIIDFGKNFSNAGKTLSNFGAFGENITRNEIKQFINTINGKIGEFAFKKFAHREFQEEIEIDLEVWDGYANVDGGQDIKLINGKTPPVNVDIKQSKHFAQWLAVEKHKIDGRTSAADVFILVLTEEECKYDYKSQKAIFPTKLKCIVQGFAFIEDFFDADKKPFFEFLQKEKLYSEVFVKKVLSKMESDFFQYDLKKTIEDTKRDWDININMYLNVELDAASNICIPKYLLRNSENDFLNLFKYLHEENSIYERKQIVAKH